MNQQRRSDRAAAGTAASPDEPAARYHRSMGTTQMKASIALVAIAAMAFGVAPVFAQELDLPPGATIAYVSNDRLSTESPQGRAGQVRVRDLQQQKAAELTERQQELLRLQQNLASSERDEQAGVLRQLQAAQAQLQLATAQAQQEMQALQRQLAAEAKAAIDAVLSEMLAGTDIQIVLNLENATVWVAPGLDLTDALLERLEEVEKSGPSAAAASGS